MGGDLSCVPWSTARQSLGQARCTGHGVQPHFSSSSSLDILVHYGQYKNIPQKQALCFIFPNVYLGKEPLYFLHNIPSCYLSVFLALSS